MQPVITFIALVSRRVFGVAAFSLSVLLAIAMAPWLLSTSGDEEERSTFDARPTSWPELALDGAGSRG